MSPRRPPPVPFVLAVAGAIVVGMLLRTVSADAGPVPGANVAGVVGELAASERAVRDLDVYRGHGAWVDAFDFAPSYSNGEPPLDRSAIDDMAEAGVDTLYLQAARNDDRSPAMLVDPEVLAAWLIDAHRAGIAVVGWYLPTFDDVDRDLAHLEAVRDFDVLGHRFDGVAVDIEYTSSVENHVERSARLVDLSVRFRESTPGEVVGAIVLPPVLTEVVNTNFWPNFPWRQLVAHYDVWLPMAYWSNRTADSGYRDGFRYLEESTRRMRANLGVPEVPVHGIGGIGDDMTDGEVRGFGEALAATGAIGGSIYDWLTLPEAQRPLVVDAVGPTSAGG